MARKKQVSVVKTAQMANTLKLTVDGRVAGTIVVLDGATAELRDAHERLMGVYCDATAAIVAFEKSIDVEEMGFDL